MAALDLRERDRLAVVRGGYRHQFDRRDREGRQENGAAPGTRQESLARVVTSKKEGLPDNDDGQAEDEPVDTISRLFAYYANTALMRRTPAELASSLIILNFLPSSNS